MSGLRAKAAATTCLLGLWLTASGVLAGVVGPPGIEIDGYELVSSVRVSRTEFEYTYRADVSNGFQDASIGATVSSGAANVTVVEGGLTFGDVFVGGTVQSSDTFTIRVDRSAPFDESQLDWTISLTPLPPTTFELIDAALAAGQIDAETALIYKTYATFGDPRLPAAYQGGDDGFLDDPITQQIRAQFNSLSPQTQTLLAPFLMRALEPGSWQELQFAAQGLSVQGAQTQLLSSTQTKRKKGKRAKRSRSLATAMAAPAATAPQAVDTANGRVRIWWFPQRPQDQARAVAFANEIDNYLWRKLTSAFRVPEPDLVGLTPTAPLYFGTDSRLDIGLTTRKKAITVGTLLHCDGRSSGATIELGPRDGVELLAHELMHAIQYAYPAMACQDPPSELDWMAEASATWAQHFTYPASNLEHGGWFGGTRRYFGALDFLKEPKIELNFVNRQREYGAYLWFLHMAGQGNNAGPVRAAWEGIASKTSRESIEAVLQSSGLGGFAQQWPQFALRNWNRLASLGRPYREYFQWDRLRSRGTEAYNGPQTVVPPNNGATILPLDHSLPPLSALYHHFNFKGDQKTHTLLFENQYAQSDPRAGVWAIVKTKGEDWVKAEDWTDKKKVVFCRDKPLEDVEELVVVITNRDFSGPPTAILGGALTIFASPLTLKLSPLPCHDWVGGASYRFDDIPAGESTVADTSVRFVLDGSRSNEFQNVYTVGPGGRTDWSVTVYRPNCATYTVSDSFTPVGDLIIILGGSTLYYTIDSSGPGSGKTVTVSCSGGPTDFVQAFSEGLPSPPGFVPLPNGSTSIMGADPPPGGWSWSFTPSP